MRLDTFKNRFDLPLGALDTMAVGLIRGKNKKLYCITKDCNGLPVAKEVKNN